MYVSDVPQGIGSGWTATLGLEAPFLREGERSHVPVGRCDHSPSVTRTAPTSWSRVIRVTAVTEA
jgi:hypothetical protein